MSFCWKDYINLSQDLIILARNSPIEKAFLRTSISRSYYGVFCIARNYLKNNKNLIINSTETHKFVIDTFKNSQDNSEQLIGQYLASLRKERNDADYEDNYQINLNKANLMLISANQVLNFFQALGVNVL
ncbi:MAG: hypothetical protein ACYDIA_24590 [Candidatus Humimicrobiaceae bacterium]